MSKTINIASQRDTTYVEGNLIQIINQGGLIPPKQIPNDLPYRCNRDPQEDCLKQAIIYKKKLSFPFISIIHGVFKECHSDFIDRMIKHSFSKILPSYSGNDTENGSNADIRLAWPPNNELTENPRDQLSIKVAEQLQIAPKHSINDIARKLINSRQFTVIRCTWRSKHVKDYEYPLMADFIEFWDSVFNKLPEDTPVIIYLCFVYEEEDIYLGLNTNILDILENPDKDQITEHNTTKGFLSKCLNIKGLFKQKDVHLEKSILMPEEQTRSKLLILPKLKPISLNDARSWAEYHCSNYCDSTHLIMEIENNIYKGNKDGIIPMYDFAQDLKDLLHKISD